jgi:hypothetical protein
MSNSILSSGTTEDITVRSLPVTVGCEIGWRPVELENGETVTAVERFEDGDSHGNCLEVVPRGNNKKSCARRYPEGMDQNHYISRLGSTGPFAGAPNLSRRA